MSIPIKQITKQPVRVLAFLLLSAFLLCACGKTDELAAYRSDLTAFFDRLSEYNATLESIDPASPDAQQILLDTIDEISGSCTAMASEKVPEELSVIEESLSSMAANMEQAKNAYHSAFESAPFDSDSYVQAQQLYNAANQDMRDILATLQNASSGS